MAVKSKRYFIYAEDDIDDAQIMYETINKISPDLDVVIMKNGIEVFDFLSSLRPEEILPCFILLDINMPGMDGFTTLQQLKSIVQFKNIPVIMYSTSSHQADVKRSMQLGASNFYTKPFSVESIERMVEQFADLCHDLPILKKADKSIIPHSLTP